MKDEINKKSKEETTNITNFSKRRPIYWNSENDIQFQCIDWFEGDEFEKNDGKINYSEPKYIREHDRTYSIFGFGLTKKGESVCMKITGFKPYFYIKIPNKWDKNDVRKFKNNFLLENEIMTSDDEIKLQSMYEKEKKLKYNDDEKKAFNWMPQSVEDKMLTLYWKSSISPEMYDTVRKEIFWTFVNHKKFKFIKVGFKSKAGMMQYHKFLKEKQSYSKEIFGVNKNIKFKLFHSDIEPLLKFFHDKKIKPSGWVKLNGGTYTTQSPNNSTKHSNCQVNITIDWNNVNPIECVDIAPFRTASFDIECGSSHGDFPLAKKDCYKLSNQLVICWLRDKKNIEKYKESRLTNENHKIIYKKSKLALKTGWKYFYDRILIALSRKPTNKNNIDDSISKIYFKDTGYGNGNSNGNSNSNTSYYTNLNRYIDGLISNNNNKFETLARQIYQICDRDIKKVKANKKLKVAVNEVIARYEVKKEKLIAESKTPSINILVKLIERVAKEYNDDENVPFKDLRDKVITKEILVQCINYKLNIYFPSVKGDEIIQIGTSFWTFGDDKPAYNNIITMGSCDDLSDNNIEVYDFVKKKDDRGQCEKNILQKWVDMIKEYDPDIILGYNIFGFDEIFMNERANELMIGKNRWKEYQKFINMGRLTEYTYESLCGSRGRLISKKLSSSALGNNYLYYFNTPGRVQIDLLKVVKAGLTKFSSYKLNSIAEHYISGEVNNVVDSNGNKSNESNWIDVSNSDEIIKDNFIIINLSTSEQVYGGDKLKILDKKTITRDEQFELIKKDSDGKEINEITTKTVTYNLVKVDRPINCNIIPKNPKWGMGKDDVSPQDIFRLQDGSSEDRSTIAKYCIQDCALVIKLFSKLCVIPNNIGMSNVCLIPFSYIFMRGQGVKIHSLIINECCENNYLLPVLEKVDHEKDDSSDSLTDNGVEFEYNDEVELNSDNTKSNRQLKKTQDEGYDEGQDDDLNEDFNILYGDGDSYEGAIVLNPDSGIYTKDPICILDFGSLYPSEMIASNLSHECHCENKKYLGKKGAKLLKKMGLTFKDVEYDILSWIDPDKKQKGKVKTGVNVERFIQPLNPDNIGLIPKILKKMLGARKATKKLMKNAKKNGDTFLANIYDGLQLAYKVTANSIYGQIGAGTSKICKKPIAAATTAGGRKCIYRARDYCLANNKGCKVVYGDTDSVFIKLNLTYEDGTYPITDVEKVQRSIDIGLAIQQKLKDDKYFESPHDLEYEKVFYPLMLITKKRYGGEKYEFDPHKSEFTSMGIVLKRRDNAPLLKYIYSGVMNIIMKDKDIEKAVQFVKDKCQDLIDNKFDLNMFVISKTLNDYYKDPESIAHKVLADRMVERDPGNKPASNERIPFAYIEVEESKNKTKLLQGDKIEHINYIKEKKLKIDYAAYIENQLMKPISQIFELVVTELKDYPYDKDYFNRLTVKYWDKFEGDIKKVSDKISELKQKVVSKILFHDILMRIKNKRDGQTLITDFLIKELPSLSINEDLLNDGIIDNNNKNNNKNSVDDNSENVDGNDNKFKHLKFKQKNIMDFMENSD